MAQRLRYLTAAAVAAASAASACGHGAPPVEPLPALPPSEPAPAAAATPVAWRSCLLDGRTPCLSAAPVRVGSELLAWSDWIARYAEEHAGAHALPITECRWIAELDQVLLCDSPDPEAMNHPLVRASAFIENRPGVVIARTDPLYAELSLRIGGHDLKKRRAHGTDPDLLAFYEALDAACARDRALCGDPAEQSMRALLERAWADKPRFVLLAFASRGFVSDDEAVSHEILHAQFFADPRYRAAIEAYWSGLSEAQRAAVRAELGALYNGGDEELMENELQAYVLMSGAERSRYASLIDPHGPALAKLLASRGLAPIAVQRRSPAAP